MSMMGNSDESRRLEMLSNSDESGASSGLDIVAEVVDLPPPVREGAEDRAIVGADGEAVLVRSGYGGEYHVLGTWVLYNAEGELIVEVDDAGFILWAANREDSSKESESVEEEDESSGDDMESEGSDEGRFGGFHIWGLSEGRDNAGGEGGRDGGGRSSVVGESW